jgi:hypothetical protein
VLAKKHGLYDGPYPPLPDFIHPEGTTLGTIERGLKDGKSWSQLGKELNLPWQKVHQLATENGLIKIVGGKIGPFDPMTLAVEERVIYALLRSMLARGDSYDDIAFALRDRAVHSAQFWEKQAKAWGLERKVVTPPPKRPGDPELISQITRITDTSYASDREIAIEDNGYLIYERQQQHFRELRQGYATGSGEAKDWAAAFRMAMEDAGIEMGGGEFKYDLIDRSGRSSAEGEAQRRKIVKQVDDATRWFPTNWATASNRFTVEIREPGFRSEFSSRARTVRQGAHQGADVMVHELGHFMEDEVRGVIAAERQFMLDRVAPSEKLTLIYRGSDEYGYEDRFATHYIGKDYGGQAYEVMSMAIQAASGSTAPRMNGIRDDAHMMRWLMGVMSTLGRA